MTDMLYRNLVWWMFRPDLTFDAPPVRWAGGVDTFDHALDVVVQPDRSRRWKDEDELVERTGHPAYGDAAGAAGIRAEGERVVADVEAGRFPFDGTWPDFQPDPTWPLPAAGGQRWPS